jgi:4-aminobutyrate aminotransferase-like enzyme
MGRSVVPGVVLAHGDGTRVWSDHGVEYIDLFAGAGVCLLGHNHKRFNSALHNQLKCLVATRNPMKVRDEAVEALRERIPASLDTVIFVSSGAEAVDIALRICASATGRKNVVALRAAYHGRSGAARAVSDQRWMGATDLNDTDAHVLRVELPESTQQLCALTTQLQGFTDVSAIIVEPVQATAGNRFPDPAFVPAIRATADEMGALLIVDEIVTGGGRTGRFLAYPDASPSPDILVLGKGLANGLPVGAVAVSSQLLRSADIGATSSTFGENPLTMAAVRFSLHESERLELPTLAATVGAAWIATLADQLERVACVGAIQGKGLLIGIEILDPRTGAHLSASRETELLKCLAETGLLVGAGASRLRVNPALVFTRADAQEATARLLTGLHAFSEAAP